MEITEDIIFRDKYRNPYIVFSIIEWTQAKPPRLTFVPERDTLVCLKRTFFKLLNYSFQELSGDRAFRLPCGIFCMETVDFEIPEKGPIFLQ